jgi:hypothetical protein
VTKKENKIAAVMVSKKLNNKLSEKAKRKAAGLGKVLF